MVNVGGCVMNPYKTHQIDIAIAMHKIVHGYSPDHINFDFWSCEDIEQLIFELGYRMRINGLD